MDDAMSGYGRWRAADESGRDEDADRAFKAVFQTFLTGPFDVAQGRQPASPEFTARTMAAIAVAAERDARRARRTRAAAVSGTVVGGAAAAYFGTGWAVSFITTACIGFLNMLVAVVVRGASGLETGADFWGVLASLGRAAAAFAADPKVTFVILAIQGVAMAALIALQRLLGTDGESFE